MSALRAPKRSSRTAVIYARVSTKTNQDKTGFQRQVQAGQRRCGLDRKVALDTIKEVVSGCLPMEKRVGLTELFRNKHADTIYVESARAISRSALVGEQLYELSKQAGIKIIADDNPELFKHDASPAEAFLRRVQLAAIEFERDLIVHRMSSGIKEKAKSTNKKTQAGQPKVVGRKSVLEKIGPLTKTTVRKLKTYFRQHDANKFGWNPLRQKISELLSIPVVGVETARRMKAEILSR